MLRACLSFSPLLALVLGAGTSCANPTVCEAGVLSCVRAPMVVELGQEFELAPGQLATLRSTSVSVTFSQVANDSRCPTDAVCVWAGDAAAQLRVQMADAELWAGQLHTTLQPKVAAAGNYDVTLIGVTPAPKSGTSIKQSDYRVLLRITAKGS
jgi:hypothetical protein